MHSAGETWKLLGEEKKVSSTIREVSITKIGWLPGQLFADYHVKHFCHWGAGVNY